MNKLTKTQADEIKHAIHNYPLDKKSCESPRKLQDFLLGVELCEKAIDAHTDCNKPELSPDLHFLAVKAEKLLCNLHKVRADAYFDAIVSSIQVHKESGNLNRFSTIVELMSYLFQIARQEHLIPEQEVT